MAQSNLALALSIGHNWQLGQYLLYGLDVEIDWDRLIYGSRYSRDWLTARQACRRQRHSSNEPRRRGARPNRLSRRSLDAALRGERGRKWKGPSIVPGQACA